MPRERYACSSVSGVSPLRVNQNLNRNQTLLVREVRLRLRYNPESETERNGQNAVGGFQLRRRRATAPDADATARPRNRRAMRGGRTGFCVELVVVERSAEGGLGVELNMCSSSDARREAWILS